VSIRLSFLGFEFRRICFKVSLTTSCYFPVMFNFMQTIVLLAFDTIYIAGKSGISPLPTIFALRNTRIHVSSSDGCNVSFYIETSINKCLNDI